MHSTAPNIPLWSLHAIVLTHSDPAQQANAALDLPLLAARCGLGWYKKEELTREALVVTSV